MGYSIKGRTTNALLTEAAVRTIRKEHEQGLGSVRVWADRYSVSLETIRKILRWETWRWVGGSWEEPGVEPMAPQALPPLTLAQEQEMQASKARFLASLGQVPASPLSLAEALRVQAEKEEAAAKGEGLSRFNEEAAKLRRGDQVLEELTGHRDEKNDESSS